MIILQTQSSTEACRIQNTNRSLLKWLEILEQELQNTKKPYTTLFSLNGQKKKWTYEAELGKKKKKLGAVNNESWFYEVYTQFYSLSL